MGGCSSTIPSNNMPANPNDAIGADLIIGNGGCSKNVQRDLARLIPNNGEYTFIGQGNKCNCGYQGKYTRQSYGGDPTNCCVNNGTMDGNLTCDPKYRSGLSADCQSYMLNYCSQASRAFNDPACKIWCTSNPLACQSSKQSVCNTDEFKTDKECSLFCIQNPGLCDSAIVPYCNNAINRNDPICSCINSPLNKYKYNPMCEDNNCIKTGYGTSSMKASLGSGCTIVDCSVVVDLKNNKEAVDFSDATFEQNCGIAATIKAEENVASNQYYLKYLIGLVLIIVIIYIMFRIINKFKLNRLNIDKLKINNITTKDIITDMP